jgi:hypothetical protein
MDNQNSPNTGPTTEQQPETKPARKHHFFRNFLYTVLIIAILLIASLGYLGFVPGVSKIFGSDKPRNLGIKASSLDEQTIESKTNIQYVTLTSSDAQTSLSLSGSKNIDTTFTDKELTALMAQHEKMWKYYPISDAQVRFNADGTGELSGILRTDRIYGYAAATGISSEDVKTWLDKVKILVANPPIYLKGKVKVQNGVMTTEWQQLEIGRLPIPISLLSDNQTAIVDFAENRLAEAGIKIQTVNIESGKANFKGSIPVSVGFSEN